MGLVSHGQDKCLNDMIDHLNNTTGSCPSNMELTVTHYILICASSVSILLLIVLGTVWLKRYLSMVQTIGNLQGARSVVDLPRRVSPVLSPRPLRPVSFEGRLERGESEQTPLQRTKTKSVSRLPWRPPQQGPQVTRSELHLLQLIKEGKEGAFYKAKMNRGACKGHTMLTCKITKEGVTPKKLDLEVSIMKKLMHHKNIIQLLDWNATEEPYILIMECVSYGTLRSFLQTHRDTLSTDPELQSLLTIASYHIALAMEHLRSKMVVHCDLALRNIMVSAFPWEVKVAEFGLARDLTWMRSRRSSRRKNIREHVPLRWYPPEYFRNNYYSFKGDVWAFGIVLWEMQTFGTLPYPDLETSESVVYYICAGRKNAEPDGCRPEIQQIMKDCWVEPYTSRPSFTDLVRILEEIMENDSDYVDVGNSSLLATAETDNHEAQPIKSF